MLLVRTPTPSPGESFPGYLVRITEHNGYTSMSDILAIAGESPRWRGGWNLDIGQIERILNQEAGTLHGLAYTLAPSSGRGGKAVVLGHAVPWHELAGSRPRICPHCIREMGFIEAIWDLKFIIACPRHRCTALKECESCGRPLSLFRPGLLTCGCGANLSTQTLARADESVLDLTSILAAMLRNDRDQIVSTTGMPVEALRGMSLTTLTRLVAALGGHSLGPATKNKSPDALVQHAAKALSDWPQGFRNLLRMVGARLRSDDQALPAGFRKQFLKLYGSIFLRHLPGDEIVFLRRAFLEFGLEEWGDGAVDRRMLHGLEIKGNGRFQSLAEAAKALGVMPVTAKRMARDGLLPLKPLQIGKGRRFVEDTSGAVAVKAAPGRSLGQREAAAVLGIPVSVLTSLRDSGHYMVRHIAKPRQSFHERDLDAFRHQVLSSARQHLDPSDSHRETIDLGTALKTLAFGGAVNKAALLIAILQGELKAQGTLGDTLGGISLGREDVMAFLSRTRARNEGLTISAAEAAKVLECSPTTLPWLGQRGFLELKTGTLGLRVTEDSVERFRSTFTSLAALAKRHHTNARKLLALCAAQGMEVVLADRTNASGTQVFIRHENSEKLATALHPTPRDREPPQIERLRHYFEQLRQTGDLLPRRAGKPNKIEIARRCGVDRSLFYDKDAAVLLESFDDEDRERGSLDKRDDLASLRRYLEGLAKRGSPLPRTADGRPNKVLIARACSFNRNILYRNQSVAGLLEVYDHEDAARRDKMGLGRMQAGGACRGKTEPDGFG